jgi:O-acetyl-ADP-ribose deacetylase (regulator of RNase III)
MFNEDNSYNKKFKDTEVIVSTVHDLCDLDVDVIVNAANARLLPGAGVCGAIRKKAGESVFKECEDYLRKYHKEALKDGEVMITSGGHLKEKSIIHAVGPMWRGVQPEVDKKSLYDAYYNSLILADQNGFRSIAFPSISTGIYGFPVELASKEAVKAIYDFITNTNKISIKKIIIAVWPENFQVYKNELNLKQ